MGLTPVRGCHWEGLGKFALGRASTQTLTRPRVESAETTLPLWQLGAHVCEAAKKVVSSSPSLSSATASLTRRCTSALLFFGLAPLLCCFTHGLLADNKEP